MNLKFAFTDTAALVDRALEPSLRRWTLVCDCKGLGPTSVPMTFLKRINSIFEPNYPERLKKSVLVPIPNFVVKIVKPMLKLILDPDTREKFCLASDSVSLAQHLGLTTTSLPPDLSKY